MYQKADTPYVKMYNLKQYKNLNLAYKFFKASSKTSSGGSS